MLDVDPFCERVSPLAYW